MGRPKDISGVWQGVYYYDNPTQQFADGGGVAFELRISQTWWQRILGTFSGSVTEDPERGVPETATVRGKLSRGALHFTKLLPIARFSREEKSVTLQELLQKYGDTSWLPSAAHPPIQYVGTFADEFTASGTWVIEETRIPVLPGHSFPAPRCTGTFTLVR